MPDAIKHRDHPEGMAERKRRQSLPSNDLAHADWKQVHANGSTVTGHSPNKHHSPAPGKHKGRAPLREDVDRDEK
jgi:hypothetical protein